MALPPLYKYLSVQGARLTLGNRTFKHAKPSDFNDIEDLTISSIFPEETEAALMRLSSGFTDVILQHLNDVPTCGSPMKEKIALIQAVYRDNPKAAEAVRAEMAGERKKPVFDVKYLRSRAEAFVTEVNEFMQGYRVLCVTSLKDSEAMWSGYAENHRGIALRIEPNVTRDSKFQLFRPVRYMAQRPPLYEDTLGFIADSLFGDQESRMRTILDQIVYSKTLNWEHESEYRLAIPLRKNEEPWNTLMYHPEEITELHFGLAMESIDKSEIADLALAVNPNITIFQAKRDTDGKLEFNRV